MKKLVAIGATLFSVWILLLCVSQGFDIEQKVHYIKERGKSIAVFSPIQTYSGVSTTKPRFTEFEKTLSVPYPPDHPPLEIAVGKRLFTVVYAPHDYFVANNCAAFTDIESRKIVLDREEGSLEIRVSVLHELSHLALRDGGGLADYSKHGEDPEDDYITPVTPKLLNTLRDNPKLVAWLQK